MWNDAILIMLACTMFVQMGLSDAVQKVLHVRFRILSCPKCASFWSCLAFLILSRCRVVDAVVASFLLSYFSLWLALLLDALALTYNKLYESITKADGTPEDATANNGEANLETTKTDGVPMV